MKAIIKKTIRFTSIIALLCGVSFLSGCGSKEKEEAHTEETYTVTWKNYDGVVLETDEKVNKGATPTYDGKEPTKEEDDDYTYTFNGWNPSVKPVSEDITYVATFASVKKPTVEEVIQADTELFEENGYTITIYTSSNHAFIIQS